MLCGAILLYIFRSLIKITPPLSTSNIIMQCQKMGPALSSIFLIDNCIFHPSSKLYNLNDLSSRK
jgi:hypothetical protein